MASRANSSTQQDRARSEQKHLAAERIAGESPENRKSLAGKPSYLGEWGRRRGTKRRRHAGQGSPGGSWSGPKCRAVWTGLIQATRDEKIRRVYFASDGHKSDALLSNRASKHFLALGVIVKTWIQSRNRSLLYNLSTP
jgi:hypothetical protein